VSDSDVARSSAKWWEAPRERVHEITIPLVRKLESRQSLRRKMSLFHATLYADMPIAGLGPYAYTKLNTEEDGARLNVVKSVVDSWVAMVTRQTPRPMTLTNGGTWSLKKLGKGLNKWLDGSFSSTGVSTSIGRACAQDAGVFGTGIAKVYEDVPGGDWKLADVAVDRCFEWEFAVDDSEAQDPRNIRNLHHSKWYDRDVLAEMFPKAKREIRDASAQDDSSEWIQDTASNLIKVTESYHLRSSRAAEDGARAVCIPGKTLALVPWELDRFPFAVLRRQEAPMGWYGIGFAQELRGIQTTINEILLAYEEAMIFFARPKWIVPRGAHVSRAHLDDRIGSVVEFDGPVPPTMMAVAAVMPGDVVQLLWQLWQHGHESCGVSQMFSSGQVPAGLKSGEAIRRYNDTSNARHSPSLKNWEAWHVDIANLMVESGRAIAKKNPKYATVYQGKREREIVLFKKIDPGRDKFNLQTFPASALSSTPSERLEQLDELYQRKLIDDSTFRVLLDWPDLEAESNLVTAPYQIAEKLIERFLDAEEDEVDAAYVAPDPDWPLEYIRARAQFAAAMAFLDDAPEPNVGLLHKFADACDALLKAKAPANTNGAPPGAMPGPDGSPMPPVPPGPGGMPPGAPPMGAGLPTAMAA